MGCILQLKDRTSHLLISKFGIPSKLSAVQFSCVLFSRLRWWYPSSNKYSSKASGLNGYVHGAEFAFRTTYVPLGESNHHSEDVPCAFCQVYDRFSSIVIPASNHCPDAWTTEYTGYLSSEKIYHYRTEFVCLDGNPESSVGGPPVQSVCGALPCPPYANLRGWHVPSVLNSAHANPADTRRCIDVALR